MKRILFVCTGNTCRSPMAEGMFRQMAEQAGIRIEVRSAGVAAAGGTPISPQARIVLRDKGIKDELRSDMLDRNLTEWADLILTMTMNHKRFVIERFPDAVTKVHTLKEYALADPSVIHDLEERQALIASLQLNMAMNQPLDAEDQQRLAELEARLPSFDVADPIGGPVEVYEACAAEIGQALAQVIEKLQNSR